MAPQTERFLLDSNIFDHLAANAVTRKLVLRLIGEGKVELVVTHVQEDELAGAPQSKRAVFDTIPRSVLATHGFVLDVSRLTRRALEATR